jgi:polyhydroxybutyrate depolymerase
MHNDAKRLGAGGETPPPRARAALLGLGAGLWAVALSMGDARDAHACGADLPCLVPGGAYLVRPPAGWDGRSALPAVVFFHGWMQSASDVMRDETMARVTSDLGVLLVAPDGAGHTWSFPGSPGHYRDEFAFVRAMLDDVEGRFPIDTRRLWASGFSQGGSMVWYAACYLGDRFAAFVPVAGDFWEPPPLTCPSGPASIRHIHGLADETFPTSGRAVAEHSHQGNLWKDWGLWLRTDGCTAPPDRVDTVGGMTCQTWAAKSCSSGHELALCLHAGGHVFNAEWLREAYSWVVALDLAGTAQPSEPATQNEHGP